MIPANLYIYFSPHPATMGEKTKKHGTTYDQTTSSTSKQTVCNYSSCFEMIKSWTLRLRVHESCCFTCFAIDLGISQVPKSLPLNWTPLTRPLHEFYCPLQVGLWWDYWGTLLRDHGGLQPRPSKGVSHWVFCCPLKLLAWMGIVDVGGMRSWVLR